jgi:hypothetical protein
MIHDFKEDSDLKKKEREEPEMRRQGERWEEKADIVEVASDSCSEVEEQSVKITALTKR